MTAATGAALPSNEELDRSAEASRIEGAVAGAEQVPAQPTPEQIDYYVKSYEHALGSLASAQDTANAAKQILIALVDQHGHQPPHAERSLVLAGRRNTITVTRGTTMTINEPAVAELETYLGDLGSGIFERLFARQTKHMLIEGARDLLKKLSLPRRTEEKVLSLFGRCIDPKTKSPVVKVDVIQPEKPARKPRSKAGKAAA